MATILTTNPNSVEGILDEEIGWQEALKRAVRSGRTLCEKLGISASSCNAASEQDFPVFVPLEFLARMQPGNPLDPLLQQVLATASETQDTGSMDPVGDLGSMRVPGLLQKYHGRVLLIASGACAVHCRYCFRRHFPYSTGTPSQSKWHQWLELIRQDRSIEEVILSGGDPLLLTDTELARWIGELNEIGHLRRLRIHTRMPVVIPQRVTREMQAWIASSRLPVYLVLHVNHAREIDQAVARTAAVLRESGATLLNQSVLLAGVNDSVSSQQELCLRLIDHQILPYYLHQLDLVQGAEHFSVGDQRALEIVNELRKLLPGYAVPRLVREIEGQPSKSVLSPASGNQ